MSQEFFLYSRKECGPCEDFKSELRAALGDGDYIVRVINIDNDAELEHQYGARVPVLVSGTTEICELRFNDTSLRTFLSRTNV